MLFSLYGCKSEITSDDVSKAIADIYSDSEGNVTIALSDGREFNLGNMKGEKGDKGDKGDPGINGIDGKDGINGKNGINGKDGSDGKDGVNGTDGRDGSSITDYVQDVTITDENILTITYGDGTVNELSRVELEGQYILKAYVDLYDFNDDYITTILSDYYCYEEGDRVKINVSFPINYSGKNYEVIEWDDLPEDAVFIGGGGSQGEIIMEGLMPGRDIDYHLRAKEITYNPVGEIRFTSDSPDDAEAILENYGVSYTISDGDASALNAGKVQCVNITANGQTRILYVNGDGWTANFYEATATIYKYKEASLSISAAINADSTKIVRATAVFYGGDGSETYAWYNENNNVISNEKVLTPSDQQNITYVKLIVTIGEKTYSATYGI